MKSRSKKAQMVRSVVFDTECKEEALWAECIRVHMVVSLGWMDNFRMAEKYSSQRKCLKVARFVVALVRLKFDMVGMEEW